MARNRTKAERKGLPPTPPLCPKCGSQQLILHGAIRNAVQQMLHNGEPVGERIARGERDIVWERLSCVRCGAECEQTDERILELQEEIERLKFHLEFVAGRLVPENRLPC